MRMAHGMMLAIGVLISGCATDRTERPLLTEKASRRIAQTCGAGLGKFHRNAPGLPYADFVITAGEVAPPDGPTPTVKCLGIALERYQHSMLSLIPNDSPAR